MQFTHLVVVFFQAHGTLNATGVTALFMVFALSGLVPIPRTALCLASGAIYGMAAVFVILPATTLCSLIGFLAARYLFSVPLYRFAEKRPTWRAVLTAVDAEGWKIIALMRFWSAMPTFMQNYTFGLTRIGTLPYILATFVFSIPQICVYVYWGALGRAALLDRNSSALGLALGAGAAVCMLAVVLIVAKKARVALKADGIPSV